MIVVVSNSYETAGIYTSINNEQKQLICIIFTL